MFFTKHKKTQMFPICLVLHCDFDAIEFVSLGPSRDSLRVFFFLLMPVCDYESRMWKNSIGSPAKPPCSPVFKDI